MNKTPCGGDKDVRGEAPWVWGTLALCMLVFALVPTLDLSVTQHLYTPGLGFIHAHDPLVLASYHWTPLIGRSILAALATLALFAPLLARLLRWLRQDERLVQRCRTSWRRMAIVAVLCGALGPGLVIEVWFKNEVGRPRPVQVTQFGGDHAFVGVFEHGDKPDIHRSFVSSHAAAGFWLISLGLTSGPVWRRRWLFIGIACGAAIGLGRMMQGGHFVSDILFAFYAVWVPCEIVAALNRLWPAASHHPQ
jgi:lipid A 4'-phosphatase